MVIGQALCIPIMLVGTGIPTMFLGTDFPTMFVVKGVPTMLVGTVILTMLVAGTAVPQTLWEQLPVNLSEQTNIHHSAPWPRISLV